MKKVVKELLEGYKELQEDCLGNVRSVFSLEGLLGYDYVCWRLYRHCTGTVRSDGGLLDTSKGILRSFRRLL